jgi:hypothetical protein
MGMLITHSSYQMYIVLTFKEKALADYRKKLLEHKELEARLKES